MSVKVTYGEKFQFNGFTQGCSYQIIEELYVKRIYTTYGAKF